MAILAAVIVLAQPTAHADETASREYRLRPQTCEGWQNAHNATAIQLPPVATESDFSTSNSAIFRADEYAVTNNGQQGDVVTGTLDQQQDTTVTCSRFVADGIPGDGELVNAKVTLSLFTATAQNSTDTFLVEGSTDGQGWFPIAMFPDREWTGSYNILPLNQPVDAQQFADLAIRVRADATSYSANTQAALDGIEIVATIAKPLSTAPTPEVPKKNRLQSGGLVAFSQESFRASEQPFLTAPKQRQKKFLFFRRGTESWSVDAVTLTNANEKSFVPRYHLQEQGTGVNLDQQIQIDTHGLQPGRYRISVAMTSSDGKKETVENDFTWGVVALNVTRAIARPGSEQEVSMAVLDDMGHTICDADLTLTVTDPKGMKQKYTTQRGSIQTSGECVDKGVTNKPDYAARFSALEPGLYHLHLDAKTSAGDRQLDDVFSVEPSASFDIVRVDFPTRIFPLAEYPVRFAITPLKDYTGIVREKIMNNIAVSDFQPEATTRQDPDDPNEQFLDWIVDWKAGETYFLSYTFDAPDISPELFLLGELTIGGSFTDAPIFSENRQWQLASDSVGAAVSKRLYESGFELQSVTANVEWTAIGGSPAIDTTTVRSGSAALRVQVTGSAATEYVGTMYNTETQDDYYYRAYVRIATSVSAQTKLIVGTDGSILNHSVSIRLNTDDTLELWDEEDTITQVGSDSAALAKDTWYRVELRFDTNNLAAVVMEARINGIVFATSSTQTLFGTSVTIALGFVDTAVTGDVYFDDVTVADDSGGNPENWPGEGKIVHLYPNAAGDTQTCDASTFSVVDEVTPNDATDYITCDANNDVAEFNVADTSTVGINANDIINYVATGNRVRRATAASGSNAARTRVPNGNSLSTGLANTSTSTTWRTNGSAPPNRLRAFDQTDTTDNDPITPADVDNTQIGVIVTDADPDTWVSTMWLLVEYVTAPGGRLYSSGFELQDVTNSGVEWATVAGTLAVSTSVKHGGAASMTVGSLGSGTEESVEQDFFAANDNGPFWGRVYLNVITLPSAENRIIEFQNSSNTVLLYITLSSTGTLSLYDEDGQVGSASRALTTSVWYRVEFKLDATGTGSTDTIEGKINGETFATDATRNLSTGVVSLVIGGNLNGEIQTTGTWNMDDVAVNKNAGSVQNSYPGAGFITHLRPNATGDNGDWTNANTEIDEVTPDDGTTVISSTTADQVEDVNLDSTSTGGIGATDTINLVSVGFRFALDSGSTQSDVAVRIRENTNNPSIEGPRWPVTTTTWQTNSSSAPRLPSLTLYDQPLESTAWTTSVLDTTQIGVRLATDGSTANVQVTALWLLVDYTSKVTIQGNAYTDEGSTALDGSATNKTVNLLINGFGSDTDEITASSGAWDVQNLTLISGDIITVYLDGETEKAATMYISDATAKSDVHLFQNRLIVRADTGSITNANIGTGDNTDTDVPVAVSSGNLTVDSGFELHVYTSDTYAPGGTVTTNTTGGLFHLDDSAAVTLANATNTIGTDVTIDTGATLTVNANTIVAGGDITATGTLTTSSGTPTITMRGTGNISGAGTKTIYNLTIGDGTTAATTLTGAATVSNDVSVATGSTFNVNADISAAGGDFTNTGTGVINTTSGTPTVTVSGTGTIGGVSGSTTFYNLTLSGTPTFGSNFQVNNNLTLPSSVTANSTTVTMAGTSGTLVGGGATIYALTIDPSSAGTTTLNTSDLTVSNTLTVAASDALTLNSGRTLTLSRNNVSNSLTLNGTINGPGRLTYQNATANAFPTGGTLAATLITRFDTVNGAMSIPARTDYGAIEAYGGSANARTVTLGTAGSQTITTSSYLYVIADAASPNDVTLQGATWDPTLNVGGDFDFTGTGTASEVVTAPDAAATWTVSGSVTLTDGTWTASAETLVMNGTANLIGASQTVKNLTIDGSGNTVTVTTSDISVSGLLTIGGAADGNNDTLSIAASRTVTSGTGGTVTFVASGTDTISGSGTLTVQNSNLDTDGTLSSAVQLDATSGDITMPARTYGGAVEVYSNSSSAARVVTMGAGTHTLSSTLDVQANNSQNVTLSATANDPTLNLTGDLTMTKPSTGTPIIIAPDTGSVTWTASGNVNFTNGTYTKGTEALVMNGTTKTLTSNSNSLNNFEVSAGSVTMSGTTTVAGNLTISGGTLTAPSSGALNVAGNWNNSGGTFTDNSSTVTLNGSSQQTLAGTMTGTSDFNNLTVTNASGSDPDASPSVIFSAAATVSGTFTATTANTKLQFNASSTYTFVNVTLNGQATTTRVALRSSTNGTQWNLTSTGTQSVSNTNTRDSNACGGITIDASNGTNVDAANNSCWTINSISLSISDYSVGFGALSTAAATWANGGATGSASDTSAHTISVATNAASGYTLTYYGATLTSGGNTIDVASISNDADGTAGSEQFGIGFSTDGNATIAAGYDHNATPGSRDWTFVASTTTTVASETGSTATENISAYYLANIAATTEPGSYSTNITYVLSAGF